MNDYYKSCPCPKPVDRKKKKLCNGWKDKPNRYCHYHGTPYAERHEIFGGANRQTSIKYGFQVDVCPACHRELEANITDWAQEQNQKWAEVYQTAYMADLESTGITKEQALEIWMSMIGQNYLEECDPL